MNYFDLVGIGDFYRFPIFFSDNVFVKFDGDALGRKLEFFEKLEQIQFAFDISRFAVDKNLHLFMFDRSPEFDFFAFAHRFDENRGAALFK